MALSLLTQNFLGILYFHADSRGNFFPACQKYRAVCLDPAHYVLVSQTWCRGGDECPGHRLILGSGPIQRLVELDCARNNSRLEPVSLPLDSDLLWLENPH